jgi:hypothetical protein
MNFINEEAGTNLPENYLLRLKRYILEERLSSVDRKSSDVVEISKEAINEHFTFLAENYKMEIKQISPQKLADNKTKLVFACIEEGDHIICGTK